jgi:hypothetical protein
MPWYLSVSYSSLFFGILIPFIYWLTPKMEEFKSVETAYPFDWLVSMWQKVTMS